MASLDVDGCNAVAPVFTVLDDIDDVDTSAIALWDVNAEKPVRVTLHSGATAITAKELSAMSSNGHSFAISMAHEPVLPLVLDIDCTQCHNAPDGNITRKCVRTIDRESIIAAVLIKLKNILPKDASPQVEDYFSVNSNDCTISTHLFFPRLFLSTLSYIFVVSKLGLTHMHNCRFDIPSHLPLPYTRVARKSKWSKYVPMPARPDVLDMPIWPPPIGVAFLDHQILSSADNAIPNYQLVCNLYNGQVPLQATHEQVDSELAFTETDILGLQTTTHPHVEAAASHEAVEVPMDTDDVAPVSERKLYHACAFTTRLWCGLPAYKDELAKNIELASWRARAINTIYTHFVALFNSALTSCEILVHTHMEGGDSDATLRLPAPRKSPTDEAAYLALYKFVRYVDTATPCLEELDVALKWRAFFTDFNKGYFWHVICCLLEHTFSSTQAHVSVAEDRTSVWNEYVASFQNMLLWVFGTQDLEIAQSISALSKLANTAFITGAYATTPLNVIYTIVNLTRDPCAPTRLNEIRTLFGTAADIVQLDSIMTKLVRATLHMVEMDGLANKDVLMRRLFYNHGTGLYVPFESSHLATIKAVYMERAGAISDEKQSQNFKIKLINLVLSGTTYTRCVFDFNPMYIATELGLFCTINGLYTNSLPPVVCKNTPIPAVVKPLVYKIPPGADQRALNIAAINEIQFTRTFFGVVVSELTSLFLLTVYIPGIKELLQAPTLNVNSAASIAKAIDAVIPFKKLGKKGSVHLRQFFFLTELNNHLQGLTYRDLLYVMWVLSKHDSYDYHTFNNNADAHLDTHYTNSNVAFLTDPDMERRPLVEVICEFTAACFTTRGDTRIPSAVRGTWAPHILAANVQGVYVHTFTTAWFTAITFLCLSIASNNSKLGGYLAGKLKFSSAPEPTTATAPQAKRRRLVAGGYATCSFESLLDGDDDDDVRPRKVAHASIPGTNRGSLGDTEDLRFKEAFLKIARLRHYPVPDNVALVGAGPYFVEMRTMCQRHHWNARIIAEFSMCISVSLQCTNPRKPIVVLQGSHRGGKSVYIRSLENAFKGSVVATIEQPLVNKADGSAQPQQVMAMESHLYIVKETDRASSGSLKSLSGADRSTSRDLYKGPGLRDTKPLVIIVSNEPVLEIRKADPATYDRFFMFTVYGMYCATPDVPTNYLVQFEQRRYQQRNIDEIAGAVVAMNLNYTAFLLAKKEGGNIITTSADPEMKKRRNEQMCANMPEMNVLRLANIIFTGRGKIKYDDMYRAVEGPLNDLFARKRQHGQPTVITMKPSANKGGNKHNIGTVHEFMNYMKLYSGNYDNGIFSGYEFAKNDAEASIMEPEDLRRHLCKKFEVVWKDEEQNSGTTNLVLMKRHIFSALDRARAIWPVIFQDIPSGDDSFASAVLAHLARKGDYDKDAQVFTRVVESVTYIP